MTQDRRTEFRLTQKGAGATFWMCLIFGVLLMMLGAFLLAVTDTSTIAKTIACALPIPLGIGIACFGYWWRNRAFNDRAPRLIVDSAFIHAPKTAAKPIPWASVEKIVMIKGGYDAMRSRYKPGYLAIDVDDPKAFAPTFLNRLMSGANRMLAGGEFIIDTDNLDGDHAAIKTALLLANPSIALEEK